MRIGGSPARSSAASARCAPAQVAARQTVRQLLDGGGPRRSPRSPRRAPRSIATPGPAYSDAFSISDARPARSGVVRSTSSSTAAGRMSCPRSRASRPTHSRSAARIASRAGSATAPPSRSKRGAAAAAARRGRAPPGSGRRAADPRDRLQHERLVAPGQRLGATDHQHLRPAEERAARPGRRAPPGARAASSSPHSVRTSAGLDALRRSRRERALDEERLVAVQEVGGAQRAARQRGQRIGRRAPAARPARRRLRRPPRLYR